MAMAQWVNRLRNNIFVNPPPLHLLCEISGALHLVQPGLTAGWQAGWQADEIQVNFKIFKIVCRSKYSTFRFVQPRYSIIIAVLMYSRRFFQVKSILQGCFLKCENSGSHMISYQSLLLVKIQCIVGASLSIIQTTKHHTRIYFNCA